MKHKKRFFIRDFSMLILHTFKVKPCSKIQTFYGKDVRILRYTFSSITHSVINIYTFGSITSCLIPINKVEKHDQ